MFSMFKNWCLYARSSITCEGRRCCIAKMHLATQRDVLAVEKRLANVSAPRDRFNYPTLSYLKYKAWYIISSATCTTCTMSIAMCAHRSRQKMLRYIIFYFRFYYTKWFCFVFASEKYNSGFEWWWNLKI